MDEVRSLTRAAGVIGFFTLLSRVMGLVRDMTVAYLFGAQAANDAFVVAFRIPNLLRRLTAEGALTAAFIPVFTDYLTHKGKDEALAVARIVFTFVAVFLALLSLCGVLFSDPLTRLFAPGFLGDPEKFSLTVSLTRLMFPYIFFVSLVALCMGVLNSFRHFMAPALSPVLLNLSMILCAITLSPFLAHPITSLAYGVLLGGIAQLVLQIPYLLRHGFSFRTDFRFRHPAVGRLLVLMGPPVIGAAVHQINVLVSTILASMLSEGSPSYLYYADRLLEFPVGVFAIALGTAALPSFASLAARREMGELRGALSYALGLVNFIAIPATLGLIVIAVPVFALFFQRGAFDGAATLQTAQALMYYALGLWGISGAKVVIPLFYAIGDTRTPVRIAVVSFLLNFALSLMLMGATVGETDSGWLALSIAGLSQRVAVFSLGHGGLALATSISSTFNFLVLLWVLHLRLEGFPWRQFLVSLSRNLSSALLMAVPLFLIARQVDWVAPDRNMTQHGIVLLGLLLLGSLLYLVLSFLLQSPQWPVVAQVLEKISKGRQ